MGQLAKSFGKRIKGLRSDQGLSQAALADRAGVSEEWVRRIERGDGAPSFDTIEAIASSLNVTAGDLFGGLAEGDPRTAELARLAGSLDDDAIAWLEQAARLVAGRPGR